ncbi:MAG: hypothetical protein ACREQ9_16800 [Candidatus Binatia bacterium]
MTVAGLPPAQVTFAGSGSMQPAASGSSPMATSLHAQPPSGLSQAGSESVCTQNTAAQQGE